MKQLKKNVYYSREDFVRHVSTIVLGRYAYDGTTAISFFEVAAYLGVSPDCLRMRKRDSVVMKRLREVGIRVKRIKGMNHFCLTTEAEEEKKENTVII